MAKPWRWLPPSPVLWSPSDLAAFFEHLSLSSIARAVKDTVRLHSFDEVDGARLLRGDGAERLQQLGASASNADKIVSSLRELRARAEDDSFSAAAHPFQVSGAARSLVRSRMCAALWGIFIGDALSMPVHWYYDTGALDRDYGTISTYVAPLARHSTNAIMNNHWEANKHNVRGLIEGNIMLHGRASIWKARFGHYHAGMQAGENTLNAHCARVVMRVVTELNGSYDRDEFLSSYKTFLTTPDSHNDSYAEAFHRQFMDTHIFKGMPLEDSAGAENHDTPSIGGFVMLPPVILSGLSQSTFELPSEHLMLTHRSERLAANARVYADLLLELVRGMPAKDTLEKAGKRIGLDLGELVNKDLPDRDVVNRVFGPACYISSSFPVALYLAYKYADDLRGALLANTNAGGENCHRGSALGAIVGAAVGMEGIPRDLLDGLSAHMELETEINGMVDAVLARLGESLDREVKEEL